MTLPVPPDFEDMSALTEIIGELTEQVLTLELKIKSEEAKVVREVLTNPAYFVKGKALAFNVIQSTYLVTGLEGGDLLSLRLSYAKLKAQLDKANLKFKVMQDKIKVFQTESSNRRGSLL